MIIFGEEANRFVEAALLAARVHYLIDHQLAHLCRLKLRAARGLRKREVAVPEGIHEAAGLAASLDGFGLNCARGRAEGLRGGEVEAVDGVWRPLGRLDRHTVAQGRALHRHDLIRVLGERVAASQGHRLHSCTKLGAAVAGRLAFRRLIRERGCPAKRRRTRALVPQLVCSRGRGRANRAHHATGPGGHRLTAGLLLVPAQRERWGRGLHSIHRRTCRLRAPCSSTSPSCCWRTSSSCCSSDLLQPRSAPTMGGSLCRCRSILRNSGAWRSLRCESSSHVTQHGCCATAQSGRRGGDGSEQTVSGLCPGLEDEGL